ncbi:alpha/beta hydrolase [Actinoalloteichus hymeniacidonis]|uniref:Esterase/lipase n=1 Tax=Actinoalloteichus hymeniacidonis TaxID=340345 RepID=A0AAC9HU33_9PSEU|nr:alpha/beta hydrolase [Actinoalloteichus hymeniacidonis]AOS65410.1 esterase/lipase [Actinoalloteichus hymeniacidonis]MBB5906504.1 arylformamidase [Actinoalloteichus hymeniacidonis]
MIDPPHQAGNRVYAEFDQAELDREYSPSSCVDDLQGLLAAYSEASARARSQRRVHLDVAYGPEPDHRLDLFPSARTSAPLQVFVHGGYWQELSKSDASFPALDLIPAGVAFASIGYGLAPARSLDEMVASVQRAVWWLIENAQRWGVDPRRIHLAGSSAGAHLMAMALCDGLLPDGRAASDVVAGATLLSGVYDLEPIRLTYVNEPLGLTRESARRNSPIHRLPRGLPPLIVARGGAETSEFARQHEDLVHSARTAGGQVTDLVVPHRNHFDLPFDLADPNSELGCAVLDQLGVAAETGRQRPAEIEPD